MNTIKTKKGTNLPLLNLKGKDYLQVAQRLVWFREEHPEGSIETQFLTVSETMAVCKSIIKIKSATGELIMLATGHKREDAKHFPDFMEKAETGAVGRALAACGYGTQFAPDLDEGERIVDSPVAPKSASQSETNIGDAVVTPTQIAEAPKAKKPASFKSIKGGSTPVAEPKAAASGDGF